MDWYTSAGKKILDADIDFLLDTIKVYIATTAYTFSALHDFIDDATNQVTGTGYTAGGETLAGKSTSAANPSVFDANDVVIAQSAGGFANGRNLINYKDTGTPGTSPVICRFGAAADFGNVNGQLTIQWAATGLVRATLS
jgi:3D (Asp-Asp-Asp) domain-containing protein